MLSDSIRMFRDLPGHDPWVVLTLHLFEVEARAMENRLQALVGQPHVPFDDGRSTAVPNMEDHHA